ncbi:Myosin light chain kinase A [Tritrichomonas foetus]|uniref:Myosin light chain kinase A n=1 Tax=Tritrichomonas foetus TaxID=1144522 RepID=A0A1J4J5S6_9EUKA|nr:Myosin light chain kinase A [Tritrichomonas foetus]|eukprot:OHS94582.1 Myosin light chain kinase A [Tritrichomonas foetus]
MMFSTISHYKILYPIGEGASSVVYNGVDLETDAEVAIKIITLETDEKKRQIQIAGIKNEVQNMRSINHFNIIQLLDVIETPTNIYLIMEYAKSGSLAGRLFYGEPLEEEKAKKIFKQIASAFSYLHNVKNIVHRDLKIDNILLTKENHVKLSDFGFSRHVDSNQEIMRTRCGSPCYASPELIKGQGYTKKTDIWSLGVILYIMVTGVPPFLDSNLQKLFNKIVSDPLTFPDEDSGKPLNSSCSNFVMNNSKENDQNQQKEDGFKSHHPDEKPIHLIESLKNLLRMMLHKDYTQRADINEVLNSDWLKENQNVSKIFSDVPSIVRLNDNIKWSSGISLNPPKPISKTVPIPTANSVVRIGKTRGFIKNAMAFQIPVCRSVAKTTIKTVKKNSLVPDSYKY